MKRMLLATAISLCFVAAANAWPWDCACERYRDLNEDITDAQLCYVIAAQTDDADKALDCKKRARKLTEERNWLAELCD